jgi:hypothetical protein
MLEEPMVNQAYYTYDDPDHSNHEDNDDYFI